MVPVRERKDDFFVVKVLVRVLWVMNNERSAEAIWVLSSNMGMVPISSGLINLKLQRKLLNGERQ